MCLHSEKSAKEVLLRQIESFRSLQLRIKAMNALLHGLDSNLDAGFALDAGLAAKNYEVSQNPP